MEALVHAKELGFQLIIILGRKRSWQEQTMYSDLQYLRQQGMRFNSTVVPNVNISNVADLAKLATTQCLFTTSGFTHIFVMLNFLYWLSYVNESIKKLVYIYYNYFFIFVNIAQIPRIVYKTSTNA